MIWSFINPMPTYYSIYTFDAKMIQGESNLILFNLTTVSRKITNVVDKKA